MTINYFSEYLNQSARIPTKEVENELEIVANREGNSIEVQKIKKKILKIKAKNWFGTLLGGYLTEKYYEWTGKI